MIKAASSILVLSLAAQSVSAEITPQELRDELFSFAAENSIEIQVAAEQFNDGELIFADVTFVFAEDIGLSHVNFPWIRLNETADGDVELTISPKNTIAMSEDFSVTSAQIAQDLTNEIEGILSGETDNSPQPTDIIIQHFNDGFNALISGDVDNYVIEYVSNSQRFTLPMTRIEASKELAVDIEIMGDSGRTVISGTNENLISDTAETIDQISVDIKMTETSLTGPAMEVTSKFAANDFKFVSKLSLADTSDDAAPEDQIPDGYYEFSVSDISFDSVFADRNTENNANIVGSVDNLRTFASLSSENLSGEAVVEGLSAAVDLKTKRLTDTFDVDLDELGYRFGVDMNWNKRQAEGYYLQNVDNLLLGGSFWDSLDPDAIIPRDPLSSMMDISLTLNVVPDNFDPEKLEETAQEVFSSLQLTLNKYFISGLGLQIEATGQADLSIDDPDFEDPKMSGAMHIDLQGAFDLIGSLMTLKLLPSDVAFGIRTAIGMVGIREGDGDHFVSDIEVDKAGSIMVNGQPFEIPR